MTRRGAALWITLNRPDALNALSLQMMAEIGSTLDAALGDRELRAVVLTGTGRAFCAGADLKAVLELSERAGMAQFTGRASRLMEQIEGFPLPVIAAINGLAVAAGLEFLLACDLVIAVRDARIGDGHAKYGLLPGAGASVRLPRKIGPSRAKYLMFTAEYVSAATLAEWGLVHEVVPEGDLEPAVDRLVAKLADKSPLTLARMKRLVDDGLGQTAAGAMRAEQVMVALHAHSADCTEGLVAFSEKRPPRFTGQ